MSISSELLTLNNTKTAIKTAINGKGGNITNDTPFADYATAITNLPSGGGNKLLTSIDVSDFSGTTFNDAKSYITGVTFPSGITAIGTSAFSNCTNLTNIDIPNGVTIIGNYAFQQCTRLTSVSIPSTVTTIGQSAFINCLSLTSVTIPNTVTTIGQEAFKQSGLSGKLTIPNSVTNIGQNAFTSCTSLTSLIIGTGVTTLNSYAFSGCSSLTSITCLATTPPSCQSNTFNGTNNCPIYVPSASVATYKAASGWSSYASRIYGLADVATVDNTTVTNADLGMTSTSSINDIQLAKIPSGTSISFVEGVTDISAGTLGWTNVTLPSTFTSFGDQDQIGSTVSTITCWATTPPGALRDRLGGANLTHIYVPASTVASYKASSVWGSFSSIIEAIPETKLQDIDGDTYPLGYDDDYITVIDYENACPNSGKDYTGIGFVAYTSSGQEITTGLTPTFTMTDATGFTGTDRQTLSSWLLDGITWQYSQAECIDFDDEVGACLDYRYEWLLDIDPGEEPSFENASLSGLIGQIWGIDMTLTVDGTSITKHIELDLAAGSIDDWDAECNGGGDEPEPEPDPEEEPEEE